jgi:hypothetical protein
LLSKLISSSSEGGLVAFVLIVGVVVFMRDALLKPMDSCDDDSSTVLSFRARLFPVSFEFCVNG